MSDPRDLTAELADIHKRLIDLPDEAFAERYELRKRQDELRERARSSPDIFDAERSDAELLTELASLRAQMKAIEKQRIDLVQQAGSGGATTSEMGNLGGFKINKGVEAALGLPKIQARIGRLKNILDSRGVDTPYED